LAPPQDAGPTPPFALTASRDNIRSQLVPTSVLQGHPSATLDRFEAHRDLGSVKRVSPITVQQNQAHTRLPHRDPADLQDISFGIVIHLEPATAHTRLDPLA